MSALSSVLQGVNARQGHDDRQLKLDKYNQLEGLRGQVSGQIDDGSFTTGSKAFNKLMIEDPNMRQMAQTFSGLSNERKSDYFQMLQQVRPMVAKDDRKGAQAFLQHRIQKMEEYNASGQNMPADPSMSKILLNKLGSDSKEDLLEGFDMSIQSGIQAGFLKEPKAKAKLTPFEEMKEVYASGDENLINMYNQKNKLGEFGESSKADNKKFDQASKMRGEVKTASVEFNKIQTAYDRIKSIEDSPAGDLALIFNFMKMLDPGSTVREGEFATAAGAASVPERLKGAYNRIINGTRLTVPQREDFLKQTDNLYGASGKRHNKKMSGFIRVAGRFGLEAADIIANPLTEESQFKILSVE